MEISVLMEWKSKSLTSICNYFLIDREKPENIRWEQLDVDIVIEATGVFTSMSKAKVKTFTVMIFVRDT